MMTPDEIVCFIASIIICVSAYYIIKALRWNHLPIFAKPHLLTFHQFHNHCKNKDNLKSELISDLHKK